MFVLELWGRNSPLAICNIKINHLLNIILDLCAFNKIAYKTQE